MEVVAAVEALEHDALDGGWWDGVAWLLRVMVYDLEQVVLGVLEHPVDALVLEDDLDQLDHVGVVEFGAERHFTDRRLRDAGVGDLLALLVGLELLDGELAWLALAAEGLEDAAISATADEANDDVLLRDADLALVANWPSAAVCWIWRGVLAVSARSTNRGMMN